MEALYLMTAVCFSIGGVCLFLALWGRNPKHLGTAVGKLEHSRRIMVWTKYSRKKVPVTTCVYLYEVNGRTYKLKRDSRSSRKSLMPRVTVVYLKGFPWFGYLEKYPTGILTILGGFALLCGGWFLLMPYL